MTDLTKSAHRAGGLRRFSLLTTCWLLGGIAGCSAPASSSSPPDLMAPRPASCSDEVRNAAETDIDCGPGCSPCAVGMQCTAAADCLSGTCTSGSCAAARTCSDGAKNGGESDIDCGGGICPACDSGRICGGNADCSSGSCLGGTCGSAACGVQNLVLMVGIEGAHGYGQLLWPHPDDFDTGRPAAQLPVAFMQTAKATGATGSTLGGTLSGVIDYTSPPAQAAVGSLLGSWQAGERYKRVFGIDNQAFRGYRSPNAMSRALDQAMYGSDTIPSNTSVAPSANFIVASRETPWLGKYGLTKSMTIIDGGQTGPQLYIRGAHNAWIDFAQHRTLMAAAAVEQLPRKAKVPVVFVPSQLELYAGNTRVPFYGENLPAGSPTPLIASDASALASAVASAAGIPAADLLPTAADQARYGFTGTSPSKLAAMRDNLIVAAKLLRRGLTAQIAIGYFDDGPTSNLFSAIGDGVMNASTVATAQSGLYNAFMDDLMEVQDPACPQRKLGDNTVIALIGDTPQDGACGAWSDFSRPSGAQNRLWVMSNGFLATGAFGGERPRFQGDCVTSSSYGSGEGGLYDLTTGDLLPFTPGTGLIGGVDLRTQYGETAAAAVLYAVVRGKAAPVSRHYGGPSFPILRSKSPPN